MIRFRDKVPSVDLHNNVFKERGAVLWGLWLKSFENRDDVLALQLRCLRACESMGNHDSKIVDAGSVD
jgi:hypothetical protein